MSNKNKINTGNLQTQRNEHLFDPEEMFELFRQKGLTVNHANKFLKNELFNDDKAYTQSVVAFHEYTSLLQRENREFDPTFIKAINEATLMHIGLISDNSNPNKFKSEALKQKIAFETFDNILTTRRVDPEVLIDMLAIHTGVENLGQKHVDLNGKTVYSVEEIHQQGVKKIEGKYNEETLSLIKKYLEEPNREAILFKKLEAMNNNGHLEGIGYKPKKVKAILASKQFKELDITEEIQDSKMKEALEDVGKTIPFDLDFKDKQKSSITDINSNLFMNKVLEYKDKEYYKKELERVLRELEGEGLYSSVDMYSKLKDRSKRTLFGRGMASSSDIFARTIAYTDNEGFTKPLINIGYVAKRVTVERMPENDSTYEIMALAAKSQGIEKPFVNCYEKDPVDRAKFVESSLEALIKKGGYNIDDITVPKDMVHLKEKYMQINLGFTDAKDLTPEEIEALGSESIPTEKPSSIKQEDVVPTEEFKSPEKEILSEGDANSQPDYIQNEQENSFNQQENKQPENKEEVVNQENNINQENNVKSNYEQDGDLSNEDDFGQVNYEGYENNSEMNDNNPPPISDEELQYHMQQSSMQDDYNDSLDMDIHNNVTQFVQNQPKEEIINIEFKERLSEAVSYYKGNIENNSELLNKTKTKMAEEGLVMTVFNVGRDVSNNDSDIAKTLGRIQISKTIRTAIKASGNVDLSDNAFSDLRNNIGELKSTNLGKSSEINSVIENKTLEKALEELVKIKALKSEDLCQDISKEDFEGTNIQIETLSIHNKPRQRVTSSSKPKLSNQ